MLFPWFSYGFSTPRLRWVKILQDLDDGHEVCRTNEVGKHLENIWKTPGVLWLMGKNHDF